MTKTTKVTTAAALVAVLAAPASARDWYGVDMDAVPWAEFCRGVAAVPVERGGGRCEVSHPASPYHGRFRDYTGTNLNPPPTCAIAADEYRRWTTPLRLTADTWSQCRQAWGSAIKERATEPARFAAPYGEWRAQYFGAWLTAGGE